MVAIDNDQSLVVIGRAGIVLWCFSESVSGGLRVDGVGINVGLFLLDVAESGP